MKKTSLLLAALISVMGLSAQARLEQPVWTCSLNFQADGGGLQFIVGAFKLTGPGQIRCMDIAGNQQDLDVKVTLGSDMIAPNIAFGKFNMVGIATGIGVARGPESLLGKYYTANGSAAAIVGVGANMGVKGGADAVTMNVALSLVKGYGLQAGFNKLLIEAAN